MAKMSSPIPGRSSDGGRKTKSYKGGTGQSAKNGSGHVKAARNGNGAPGNMNASTNKVTEPSTKPVKATPVHTSGTPGAFVHK